MSVVQDLMVTPLWMALVWAAHAMVVMLEWGFTVDLLDSPVVRGLGTGLRQMQERLTDPLLPLVLAGASMLAVYQGVVRRRVSHALGDTALMASMMVCGIWVIGNPAGTVGTLSQWANDASLGALAVGSRGTPTVGGGGLGQDMQRLFAATVEAPWCYLEFGQVSWCRARQVDPRLRAAGRRISAGELALAAKGGAGRDALSHGAEMIRAADTNGELFLALPANSPARNSITEANSLLRAICQSDEATRCTGPTAAQAEFRTNVGTWPRVGGLLLIAIGMVGMLLLLGFVGLRLLAAATLSLLLLLLAPLVVLTPAFGERGRSLFLRWASQLLSAILSKLLFAFVLGVLLAVLGVIASLPGIGWWTQWLLMSAFAWTVFNGRHRALGFAGGATPTRSRSRFRPHFPRAGREAVQLPLTAARTAVAAAQRAVVGADPDVTRSQIGAVMAGGNVRVEREQPYESGEPANENRGAQISQVSRQLTAKQLQLERIRRAESLALTMPDPRRTATLAHRAERLEEEVGREERALLGARYYAEHGRPMPGGEVDALLGADAGHVGRDNAPTRGLRDTRVRADANAQPQQEAHGVHAADWPRGPGSLPTSTANAGTGGSPLDTVPPREAAHWWNAPEQTSRVMQDIREVEAGRKRNPGYDQE